MPRQIRIECPGAIYHVINCGDRREAMGWAIPTGAEHGLVGETSNLLYKARNNDLKD